MKMEQKARLPNRNAGNLKALNQNQTKEEQPAEIKNAEPKRQGTQTKT